MVPLVIVAGVSVCMNIGFLACGMDTSLRMLPTWLSVLWFITNFGGVLFASTAALVRRQLAARAAARALSRANGHAPITVKPSVLVRRTEFDTWTAVNGIDWASAGGRDTRRRRHRASWRL